MLWPAIVVRATASMAITINGSANFISICCVSCTDLSKGANRKLEWLIGCILDPVLVVTVCKLLVMELLALTFYYVVYGLIAKSGQIIYLLVVVFTQPVSFQYGSKIWRKLPEVYDRAPVWGYSVWSWILYFCECYFLKRHMLCYILSLVVDHVVLCLLCRRLDFQHSLLKQTLQRQREVFALVKERIITTQTCMVIEQVHGGGSCSAFLGFTVPKKIQVRPTGLHVILFEMIN